MTPERAASTEIHFGCYAGYRLDGVAATSDGRTYLRWLAAQPWLRGRLRQALPVFLAPVETGVARGAERSRRESRRGVRGRRKRRR